MASTSTTTRRRIVNGFIACVVGAAVLSARATWTVPRRDDLALVVTFIALTIATRAWKIKLYQRGHAAIYPAIIAAGAIYLGPTVGALLGLVAGLVHWPWKSHPRTYVFDAAQLALTAIVLGSLPTVRERWSMFPEGAALLVDGVIIAAFMYLLNWGMVVTVMAIDEGGSPFHIWKERSAWLAPHFLVFGLLAVGMGQAALVLGVVGVLVFSLPLFMMRLVVNQFMAYTRDHVQQLHEAHEELGKKHTALESAYDATRTAIAGMLRARDDETEGHSERVVALAITLGRAFGLSPEELTALDMGAQLHDIGKVGVSDAILHKPGKLTPEEWAEMRRHPIIGDELISAIPFLAAARPVVRHHHERWDGTGYPDKLRGEEIPFAARIFALADVYDALASDRPYRRAMSHEAALAEIAKGIGTHFDPACVNTFLRVAQDWSPRQSDLLAPLHPSISSTTTLRRRLSDWQRREESEVGPAIQINPRAT